VGLTQRGVTWDPWTNPFGAHNVGITQIELTWDPWTNPFGAHTGVNSDRGDMGSMTNPIFHNHILPTLAQS